MKIIVKSHQYAAFAIFAAIAGGLPDSANAQVQFPVEKPTPKVGDVWKYRQVDLWNGKELSNSEVELVSIEAGHFITRVKSSSYPGVRTGRRTTDLWPCRNMKNSDQEVCAGAFRFPMQLGQKTEYQKVPWDTGNGYWSGKCEVKAEEKVTVPAGTFDAVRVECAGYWTRVFEGNFTGRFTETIWYAPKVNRGVRSQYFDSYSSGSPNNKTQTELVEFISK